MGSKAARALRTFAALAFASASLGEARVARADSMDPTPERLVLQPPGLPAGTSCQQIAANPSLANPAQKAAANFPCLPDNVAFKNLVSELGAVIAPTAFHPARTTGFGGFVLSLEMSFTHINADDYAYTKNAQGQITAATQYWHAGTQGSSATSNTNASPNSLLGVYSIKARKGLPLGFELAGVLGYIPDTSLVVGGGDIRWALLEGFRKGFFGYLPDVAIGSGVRTMTGSSKMYLTTLGIDAEVSKPFTLGDTSVLTPYAGYQHLVIFGNSAVLDSTPNVNAMLQCGYQGRNSDGTPKCGNTYTGWNGAQIQNNGDFNNNFTFNSVTVNRDRAFIGLNYRLEVLYLAAQFMMDIVSPNAEDSDLNTTRQWTTSLEAGVFF